LNSQKPAIGASSEALLAKDWTSARSELVQDIRRLSLLLKTTIQRLEGKTLKDESLPVMTDED
jgi:hypothetical protein